MNLLESLSDFLDTMAVWHCVAAEMQDFLLLYKNGINSIIIQNLWRKL